MGVVRNGLAFVLIAAGLTLLGLAVIDWLDYIWTILVHVQER